MQRIVYYIIQASAAENQNGIFHYSRAFETLARAKAWASRIKNDFVVIEKHHEIWDRWEWRPDWDNWGDNAIEVID